MQSLKNNYIQSLMLAAVVFSLLGCSSKPSNSDVERSIMEISEQGINEAKAAGVSDALLPTVHSVKNLGCTPAQNEPGYICDIEAEVSLPGRERIRATEKYRVVETDDGWRAINKIE